MKPDCRRVLSQIASYSVEELSLEDADAFTRHLDDCPPCKGHWVLFEKTLTTLSQVDESDISVHQSQQMWLTCLEHAKKKAHALPQHALPQIEAPSGLPSESHHEVEVLPQPFRSDSSQREGDRRGFKFFSSHRTGNFGWLQGLNFAPSNFAPRLGFSLVFAGGAAAVLAAAFFISPGPRVASVPIPQVSLASAPILPSLPASKVAASFQTPPYATLGLIDYHSEMAFEPFSDHVAATLVSHTATQP